MCVRIHISSKKHYHNLEHYEQHKIWRERERHTGISRGNGGRAREITVEIVTTFCLIVRIHDKGGMQSHVVRVETSTARLNRAAVHPLAAHIVYIGLQRRVARLWLRHAPLLPGLGWRRRRWWFWSRLQYIVVTLVFPHYENSTSSHIPTVGLLRRATNTNRTMKGAR